MGYQQFQRPSDQLSSLRDANLDTLARLLMHMSDTMWLHAFDGCILIDVEQ